MVPWQVFPSLPPSLRAPLVSLAPTNPLSFPIQTPATQATIFSSKSVERA